MTTEESVHSIQFASPDEGEETARAELYGVLAALFAGPPQAELLRSIATAPVEGDGVLEQAWKVLATDARRVLDSDGTEAVREEYERLFIGIGKPEVMLYGSFYLSGFLMERPLAALRTDLAQLGIERAEGVVETEDHIASLCEVMRYLIAADDSADDTPETASQRPPVSAQALLASQKAFFATHLQPWASDACSAIMAHRQAHFYRHVAELAQKFFEVEAQAFEIG